MLQRGQRLSTTICKQRYFLCPNPSHTTCYGWRNLGDKEAGNSPFLGRGILGSGWQRHTCGEVSPDPVEVALRGDRLSIGLQASTKSSPFIASSRDVRRFLVERGDVTDGEGSSSSFVRCTGFDVGADLAS